MPHSLLLAAFPKVPTPAQCTPFTTALLGWFSRHQRPLPWRENPDPYRVWVSEIMLQQTQMERGVAYFNAWVQHFPTLQSLAAAPLDDVLKAWEGLGYYSRAKNLHAASRIVVAQHNGVLPHCPKALAALPGIGRYTAGAICAIAYNAPCPAVDANVERVFARLFDVDAPAKSRAAQQFFWQTAHNAIPEGQARQCIQALMEFGALVCNKKPLCGTCPVQAFCQAHHLDLVFERPITGKKIPCIRLEMVTALLLHKGRVLVQKRLHHGAWAGLWEFPGGRRELGETPEQGAVREFAEETELGLHITNKLGVVQHAYTRYRITMHCFVGRLATLPPYTNADACVMPPAPTDPLAPVAASSYIYDAQGFPVPCLHAATQYRWVLPSELDALAFPAGHRKLLDIWRADILQAVK